MPQTQTNALKRRLRIAERVRQEGEVKVDALAEWLDVTVVTVRSDLNYLEEQGELIRSFGGAISVDDAHSPMASHKGRGGYPREIMLAYHGASLVPDDDRIFIWGERLAYHMAMFLEGTKHVRLVSNAPALIRLTELYENITLSLLGGDYNPATRLVSPSSQVGAEGSLQDTSRAFILLDGATVKREQEQTASLLRGLAKQTCGLVACQSLTLNTMATLACFDELILLNDCPPTIIESLTQGHFQIVADIPGAIHLVS